MNVQATARVLCKVYFPRRLRCSRHRRISAATTAAQKLASEDPAKTMLAPSRDGFNSSSCISSWMPRNSWPDRIDIWRVLRTSFPSGNCCFTRTHDKRVRPLCASPTIPSKLSCNLSTGSEASPRLRFRTKPSQMIWPFINVGVNITMRNPPSIKEECSRARFGLRTLFISECLIRFCPHLLARTNTPKLDLIQAGL